MSEAGVQPSWTIHAPFGVECLAVGRVPYPAGSRLRCGDQSLEYPRVASVRGNQISGATPRQLYLEVCVIVYSLSR